MKRYVLIIAALIAAFASACTREDVPQAIEYRKITLSARSGDVDTKSSRDADGKFYWSPSDEISLFRGTGGEGGWKLTSTNAEPAASAEFTGEVPAEILDDPDGGKYWAIYPYNEANSLSGGVLTTVVPSEQVAAKGTFADGQFVSIGCSDDLTMNFYHLCGGIKFTLANSGITQITLTGNNNEILAGKVTVNLDSDGHPTVENVIEGKKTVTLTCEGGFEPGVEYFIVTLPVTFSEGFTVDFGGGLTRVVNTAMTVNRAKFQWSRSALDCEFNIEYQEYYIENDGVRGFVSPSVDYSDDPDYTITYATDFRDATDDPQPFVLTWTGGRASSILMSYSPQFDNAWEVSGATSSPVNVYNLIPGEKHYYKVLGSNGAVLKQGCVTPVGQVRMIYGVAYNFRDLGGWKADGGHIAYGKLYRGPNIDGISRNSTKTKIFLEDLGIGAVMDLRRTKTDGSETPSREFTEIDYITLPVLKNLGTGTGETSELYQKAIRQIIAWLGEGKPVYFHCAGGADRTGTLAFLIEALLGVSESDMAKEYELTSFDGNGHQSRLRNMKTGNYIYSQQIYYLRNGSFGDPSQLTINELVKNWAKTQHSPDVDPLSDEEIALLRQYLLVAD